MKLEDLTLASFGEGLRAKKFSAKEVARAYLDVIREKNEKLNAYLSIAEESAIQQAEEADLALEKGKSVRPLLGAPLAIKDNILIEGSPATAASKILEHYTAAYDATAIAKLKAAGAVFLGKTNLDEFAMGASTENSAFGVTKNPYDIERVPGGSSGGSAAAVAADMALAALGSDTGGSVRQPAAFCGVVGLKPTYGAVSRFGLIAMASSLDQIGPFAKTAEDAAILYDAIRGKDGFDSTSVDADFKTKKLAAADIKKLKIGIPKEYFIEGADPAIAKGVEEARKKLEKIGFTFKEISLPNTKYAISVYYIIMPAEVSTNLARLEGVRYGGIREVEKDAETLKELYLNNRGKGFGLETQRRILLGTFVLSAGYYDAYYSKAQKTRRLIKEDFDRAFDPADGGVDVIFAPTTPTPAFKIGEKSNDPVAMYLSDVFTCPANLAGVPALSMPVHKYSVASHPKGGELPVGFQLIGKHFHEADLLNIGMVYEQE